MKVLLKNKATNQVEVLGKLLTKDGIDLYAIRECDKMGFGVSVNGELNGCITFDAFTLLGAVEFQEAKESHVSHVEFFDAMFDATACKIK